ncbi:MAG: macro domain-containing protein, partial [Candidatus Eisenbacteria bacterium]|nr:macro domain-containing protein [Candidatus Eisenbacteria bacterium]
VQPGRMLVFETGTLTPPRFIVNFPTKRHWRGKSRLEDIEAGLSALIGEIRAREIRSIAVPPLGAGLGGLAWSEVRARIESAAMSVPQVRFVVYEPLEQTTPTPALARGVVPKMTSGRAALIGLMAKYLAGSMDPSISLLELHKLMYFMQVAGEPLRLRFRKATYGPYAENLRNVLAAIEGYFLSGYGAGGDSPEKPLELVPGAVVDAIAVLANSPPTDANFARVVALTAGFESAFGLELLSTVHWVIAPEGARSEDEVVARTYEWGERKRAFLPRQIHPSRATLLEQGWV